MFAYPGNNGHVTDIEHTIPLTVHDLIVCRLLSHDTATTSTYMVNLCAISVTLHEHLERLEDIFKTLLRHGLIINAKKCQFAMTEITFCGLRVNAEGLSPESEKSAAIMRIPVPRTVHEVCRFLGMVGWSRRFTPKFPTISKPLNSLLEGEKTFR